MRCSDSVFKEGKCSGKKHVQLWKLRLRECHSKCTSAHAFPDPVQRCMHITTRRVNANMQNNRRAARERRLSIKKVQLRERSCLRHCWRFARCASEKHAFRRRASSLEPRRDFSDARERIFQPIRRLTRRIIKMAVSQIYAPLVASRCQITTWITNRAFA